MLFDILLFFLQLNFLVMTEEMLFQSFGGVRQINVFLQMAIVAPILLTVIFDRYLAGDKTLSLKIWSVCCLSWSLLFLFLFTHSNDLAFGYIIGIFGLLWGASGFCMLTDKFIRASIFPRFNK